MKRIALIVDTEQAGQRLDRFLVDARPEISRGEAQQDIRDGRVSVSGDVTVQPSRRVREKDEIVWEVTDRAPLTPHSIPLRIVYEDDHIVAVDKPIGLVVHPGAGTKAPTLVEGLLHGRTLPPSDDPVRPGIVHRLDKETSGVLVVAKTPGALTHLQRQFASRTVAKSYLAVVGGTLREEEGTIDAPVGRDPARPRRMSVQPRGRPARTDFLVLQRLGESTLLLARPHTGRTHQLRVHFEYIGHPVLGDAIYGTSRPRETDRSSVRRPGAISASANGGRPTQRRRAQEAAPLPDGTAASRLMLHAWRLTVRHPVTGELLELEAAVPPEFPRYTYEALPRSNGNAV